VKTTWAALAFITLIWCGALLLRRAAPGFWQRSSRSAATGLARVPSAAAVVAVVMVGAGVWYLLGRAVTLPIIFGDELIYFDAARGLARDGTVLGSYGVVVPAFDSIAFLVTSDETGAYHLIQLVNSIAMASAAIPAYLLARRALDHPWALAVSALTVSVPWMVYARFVLTEPLFYPVFLWFVVALARALERPTTKRQLAALAVAALAFQVRTQAAVLFPAIAVAVLIYGASEGAVRRSLRSFAFTWCAGGVAAVVAAAAAAADVWHPLGAYGVLLRGWWHPHGLLLWTAANVTSLTVGVGVLVAAAAPFGVATLLGRGTPSERALAAAIASSVLSLLATVVLLSESAYGLGSVHERNLFYVVPLLLIAAFAWAVRGFPTGRMLAAVTLGGLIALALVMPPGILDGSSVDALSFKFWTQLDPGPLTARATILIAVVVGVVLLFTRSAAILVLTFVVASVGVASASNYHTHQSREAVAGYQWVDAALVDRERAALIWVDCSSAECGPPPTGSLGSMAVYTEIFNSSIAEVGHLGADNPRRGLTTEQLELRRDGTVMRAGLPIRSRYVVVDSRVRLRGARVAVLRPSDVGEAPDHETLVLWRTDGGIRLRGPGRQ
jgi:hypothetical protein